MKVDASAALGLAQRMGVGLVSHLQTVVLWSQEQVLRKELRLDKVVASDNCEFGSCDGWIISCRVIGMLHDVQLAYYIHPT